MTSRTPLLALAAAMILASPAPAQQAWERDLDFVRRTWDNGPLQNIYGVSLPHLPTLPDAANTGTALSNKCVGDPDGPPAGDGIFNADDLICYWWTARSDRATAGTFTLQRPRTDRCAFEFRAATVALGEIRFAGTPYPIEPGMGLQVRITTLPGSPDSPRNRARFEGNHDPAFPGRVIAATPTCAPGQAVDCCGRNVRRFDLVSVPYHSVFTSSFELLCGLDGVDWQDADADGLPDACWDDLDGDGQHDAGEPPTGLFDGRVAMSVGYHDNRETINAPVYHYVTFALGRMRFGGVRFDLRPGEAYLVDMSRTHSPTIFLPDVP